MIPFECVSVSVTLVHLFDSRGMRASCAMCRKYGTVDERYWVHRLVCVCELKLGDILIGCIQRTNFQITRRASSLDGFKNLCPAWYTKIFANFSAKIMTSQKFRKDLRKISLNIELVCYFEAKINRKVRLTIKLIAIFSLINIGTHRNRRDKIKNLVPRSYLIPSFCPANTSSICQAEVPGSVDISTTNGSI